MRKVSGLLAMAIGALAAPVLAQTSSPQYSLQIERQPLLDTLRELSKQTGLQLVGFLDTAAGQEVQFAGPLKGEYTAEAALNELLAQSNFVYRRVNDRTIAIVSRHAKDDMSNRGGAPASFMPLDNAARGLRRRVSWSAQDASYEQSGGRQGVGGYIGDAREEVVVVGTHIRGQRVPPGSSPIVLDRDDISSGGYSTVQDLLRTLPQNFGGGTTEFDASDTSALNLNAGTAINLRGLGPSSTLVLVNGRRQPAGGLNGAFVDISSIALSAIERVEILSEGASAIYGSDAIAGVVNFVLRKDYEGAETSARFGTLSGDADEKQISQIAGFNGAGINALVGYQYYERDSLARADRAYTASDDLRRFGGSDYRRFYSNPGNILNPATFQPAFAIPRGQDGRQLTPADLILGETNYSNTADAGHLLPRQTLHSAFFSLSSDITDSLSVFAEGRFGRRKTEKHSPGATVPLLVPASNPFFVDPFGGMPFVFVAYNFLSDLGPVTEDSKTTTYSGATGLALEASNDWKVTLSGSYGRERARFESTNSVNPIALALALADPDPATAFNPFGDGSSTSDATLNAIRAVQRNHATSTLWEGNLLADGPLFDLAGGATRLAVGMDYRSEDLISDVTYTGLPSFANDIGRDIFAVFGELTLPLLARERGAGKSPLLSMSLAGRNEHYSDFGDTFDPKLGLTLQPTANLAVRATWGTSFRAPRLIDLLDSPTANTAVANQYFIQSVADPRSPTGQSSALIITGGNPDLEPEKARTWTVGLDMEGDLSFGIDVSLTYFDVRYTDRIATGGPKGNPYAILQQEGIWSPIIVRNPTRAQVDSFCNSPAFAFGDCSVVPNAIIDVRLRNLAVLDVRGLDFSLSREFQTEIGEFSAGLSGVYTLDWEQAVTTTAPQFDIADTVANPLALRLRGALSWTKGAIGTSAFVNYAGKYRDNLNLPNRDVDSWTTVDVQVAYRSRNSSSADRDWSVALTASNVFDKEPPFVNAPFAGYDTANANLFGRMLSAQVSMKW